MLWDIMNEHMKYIEALYKWNMSNENTGYDEYRRDEKFNYPEADAYWGNGHLLLNRLDKALYHADSLLKSQLAPGTWGLPWDHAGNKKDLPYTYSTVLAAEFLKNLSVFDDKFSKTLENTYNWLMKKAYIDGTIIYSPDGAFNYPITNAVALTGGFLSKCSEDFNVSGSILNNIADYISSKQLRFGLWTYSDRNSTIDNFHNVLILKGLLNMYRFGTDELKQKIKPIFDKGTNAYINRFLNKDMALRRFVRPPYSRILKDDATLVKKTKKIIGYMKHKMTEPNLWDYAYAIDLFNSHLEVFGQKGEFIAYRDNLITSAIDKLWDDVAFNFFANEKEKYVRPNSKMFESLAKTVAPK